MPDGLPRGGHVKCCRYWLQAVSRADGQWSGPQAELSGSGVSRGSPAGTWLVQALFGKRAAGVSSRAVLAMQGQPRGAAGGCLRLSRPDVGFGGVGSGCGDSERRRRGLRSGRQPGRAAGAWLAAQCRGAVCRQGAGVVGAGVGSVVAGGAGGGGPGGGLADAAAPLAVVVLALLSGWGERAFPPRPAVCSAVGGLSIVW